MRHFVVALITVGSIVTAAGDASAFVLNSSSKESVFVATVNESLDANGQFFLGGSFPKAKSKRVLRVDVTVTVTQNASVKGVSVMVQVDTPFGSVGTPLVADDCNNANVLETLCSVTTTEWFDLDALEASQPGLWIGQPLDVGVIGGATGAVGAGALRNYRASVSAQFVKK